jgi:hypothetical protein
MTRKCGLFVGFIDTIWGYPHIPASEHQAARAKALYLCRLEPQRPLGIFRRRYGEISGTRSMKFKSGGEPLSAKALKGFSGRTVLEIIDDFDGDTFRCGLRGALCRGGLHTPCVSEEIEKRNRHTQTRDRVD